MTDPPFTTPREDRCARCSMPPRPTWRSRLGAMIATPRSGHRPQPSPWPGWNRGAARQWSIALQAHRFPENSQPTACAKWTGPTRPARRGPAIRAARALESPPPQCPGQAGLVPASAGAGRRTNRPRSMTTQRGTALRATAPHGECGLRRSHWDRRQPARCHLMQRRARLDLNRAGLTPGTDSPSPPTVAVLQEQARAGIR